jgi:uncharacterized membrane protein (TIGR02234 family)
MTDPRRIRLLALLLPVVVAAVAVLAWSQPWVALELTDGRSLAVAGDAAAPAIPPFALAGLALVGALTLAGLVFRVVLGLLQALLGVGIIASASLALADPIAAAAGPLTEATGVAGREAVRALVAASAVTAWPWVAVAAGVLAIVTGVAIALTASRWPQRSRRYDAVRFAAESGDARTERLDVWDALSDGDDPTAR